MEASRNDLLGELAADAALERTDFLVQASQQLKRFLEANDVRLRELGGLVLIDDESDYLSVAPDLTFRSRSRYLDEDTGEWVSETEVIETTSELVELYNLADVFAAFAESAKTAAGLAPEPTAAEDLLEVAGVAPDETVPLDSENPYAAAADEWAAAQDEEPVPDDEEAAARRLYDLALSFQERSQQSEARLLEQFETAASRVTAVLGDLVVVDDDDERLTLEASGSFVGEVVPESEAGTGEWRRLSTPDELVEFYDPTDVFGDLADALAEAFPEIAPEATAEDGDDEAEGEDGEAEGDAAGDGEDAEDGEDAGGDYGAFEGGSGATPTEGDRR
jgi:hypothetical protein